MSDHRGFKWSQVKNVRTALRTFHDNRDEGQPRGWERQREDDRPPAKDPPPPSRPAYSYSQHYQSDPGLHSGFGPGYNSPPLPAQGSPPLLHNQHYQGQYQAGPCLQGYGAPPQPNQYHPTHPQAYGQNQAISILYLQLHIRHITHLINSNPCLRPTRGIKAGKAHILTRTAKPHTSQLATPIPHLCPLALMVKIPWAQANTRALLDHRIHPSLMEVP